MNNQKPNRWYLRLCVGLIVIIVIPYILGFAIETNDLKFSGSFIGVDDQNSYLAKMRYGYEGNILYRSPYTNFPQSGIVAFLPLILLGKLAGGENLVGQLQFFLILFRIASASIFIYSLKLFFEFFVKEPVLQKIAVVVVIFGGGFGFLFFSGLATLWHGRLPLEFYSPEAFSFLALLTLPHIIVARSLVLLTVTSWFSKKGIRIGKLNINYLSVAVIYSYLIYLFQPITLPILFGIIVLYFLINAANDFVKNKIKFSAMFQQESFRSTVLYFIMMLPAIIYNLYLLLYDPFIKAWGAQNKLITAPLTDYLLAYGLYLIFLILYFIKENNVSNELKTLSMWVVISFIGIYLPISIQRRFIEGIWVFLVLFTILSIQKFGLHKQQLLKMRIAIFIFSLTSLFIFSGSIFQIISKPDRIFVGHEKLDLYNFINENIHKEEYILANHDIGNEIPVWTGARTVTGVGPESIKESDYLTMYQEFINGSINETEFVDRLATMKIDYFVVDNLHPINCDLFYQNDAYSLCRVGAYE